MKIFFRKNCKGFLILLSVTIIIGFIYFMSDKCGVVTYIIDSIASILAVPSIILSFIVLKVIDIKPENLDAYHRLRVMKDNEKKENKKKAKKAFGEELNVVRTLNEQYKKVYKNTISGVDIANSVINQCREGLDKLKDFFSDTKEYIFKDFLPDVKNLGELKTIDRVDVSIVNLEDEHLLKEKLNSVRSDMFKNIEAREKNQELFKLLFDDNALMETYLKTCARAYEEIVEEKENEV